MWSGFFSPDWWEIYWGSVNNSLVPILNLFANSSFCFCLFVFFFKPAPRSKLDQEKTGFDFFPYFAARNWHSASFAENYSFLWPTFHADKQIHFRVDCLVITFRMVSWTLPHFPGSSLRKVLPKYQDVQCSKYTNIQLTESRNGSVLISYAQLSGASGYYPCLSPVILSLLNAHSNICTLVRHFCHKPHPTPKWIEDFC